MPEEVKNRKTYLYKLDFARVNINFSKRSVILGVECGLTSGCNDHIPLIPPSFSNDIIHARKGSQQSDHVGIAWIFLDATGIPLQFPRSYGYLQFPQRYPQNFIFHNNTHKISFNVFIARKSMINPRQYPHLYINIAI